jgi:hypothetical protein
LGFAQGNDARRANEPVNEFDRKLCEHPSLSSTDDGSLERVTIILQHVREIFYSKGFTPAALQGGDDEDLTWAVRGTGRTQSGGSGLHAPWGKRQGCATGPSLSWLRSSTTCRLSRPSTMLGVWSRWRLSSAHCRPLGKTHPDIETCRRGALSNYDTTPRGASWASANRRSSSKLTSEAQPSNSGATDNSPLNQAVG